MLKHSIFIAAVAAVSVVAAAKTDRTVYDKPAKDAGEAVTISNGTAGATIYGSFPDEHIELSGLTVSKTAAGVKGNSGKDFTPFAKLDIHHSVPVKNRVTGYERGMDAETSTAFTGFDMTGGKRLEEFYASTSPDSVIVIRYNDEVPLFCTIFLTSDYAREVKSFDDRITMTGTVPATDAEGRGTDFTTILKVIPGKGNITTNPDASLTLNYMKGATIVISTVKHAHGETDRRLAAEDAAALARLRVFRSSLDLADGLEAYRGKIASGKFADVYASEETAADGDAPYREISAVTCEEGTRAVVLRAWPERIVFLPGSEGEWGDGESTNVEALGMFRINFRWEKGKVTGGTITYTPKDYMEKERKMVLVLNGESYDVEFKSFQSVPLENFVDLVRPFIQ